MLSSTTFPTLSNPAVLSIGCTKESSEECLKIDAKTPSLEQVSKNPPSGAWAQAAFEVMLK